MYQFRPGEALPELRRNVTQELVSLYAEASEDWNPLHTDPEFASSTRFGRTIAHGQLSLAFVSQCLSKWFWPAFSRGGDLSVIFIGPVMPGDEVVVRGKVVNIDYDGEGRVLSCDVGAYVLDRKVLAATARIPLLEEELR